MREMHRVEYTNLYFGDVEKIWYKNSARESQRPRRVCRLAWTMVMLYAHGPEGDYAQMHMHMSGSGPAGWWVVTVDRSMPSARPQLALDATARRAPERCHSRRGMKTR